MKEVKMTVLFVIVILICLFVMYKTNPDIIKEMDDALFNFVSKAFEAIGNLFNTIFEKLGLM